MKCRAFSFTWYASQLSLVQFLSQLYFLGLLGSQGQNPYKMLQLTQMGKTGQPRAAETSGLQRFVARENAHPPRQWREKSWRCRSDVREPRRKPCIFSVQWTFPHIQGPSRSCQLSLESRFGIGRTIGFRKDAFQVRRRVNNRLAQLSSWHFWGQNLAQAPPVLHSYLPPCCR